MPDAYWVLMEHDRTGETAMVLVPAESPRAAELWGEDCDRGAWEPRAVVGEMPTFLPLAMFDAREVERDRQRFYRQTWNLEHS